MPYSTQPTPVQQEFGVEAAHPQVAFRCHLFDQRPQAIHSCCELSAAPAASAQPRRFPLRLKAPRWSSSRGGKLGWG